MEICLNIGAIHKILIPIYLFWVMVDLWGFSTEGWGNLSPRERDEERVPLVGPSAPSERAHDILSLIFIKKNIEVLRTMIKEHDQRGREKATTKKLTYDG
nr:hypothetical protein [Tanacetum cinerariifolium]